MDNYVSRWLAEQLDEMKAEPPFPARANPCGAGEHGRGVHTGPSASELSVQ